MEGGKDRPSTPSLSQIYHGSITLLLQNLLTPMLTAMHSPWPYTALRNLANYGYQIPQHPDQLTTPTLGDSIRSLALRVTCSGDNGVSCSDLVS